MLIPTPKHCNVVPFGTNLLRTIGIKVVPENAEVITHANHETLYLFQTTS